MGPQKSMKGERKVDKKKYITISENKYKIAKYTSI